MENSSFLRYLDQQIITYNGSDTVPLTLPLTLQLEVTSVCNMKCSYCYNSSGQYNYDNLNMQQWCKVLNQLISDGGVFQCTFSGGEPLLFDNLFELMDIIHNDGACLSLITNGSLLTENKVKKMMKYRWNWIQISLDSSRIKLHDSIRGYQGAWDGAIQAIKHLKKHSFPVHIAAVVTKDTINYMEELVELCISFNIDKIRFSEVLYSGKACTTNLCFDEKTKYIFETQVNTMKRKFFNLIDIELATSYNEQMNNCLKYSPLSAIIRPNGDVKVDCVLPFVIGNVKHDSFKTIWKRVYDLYGSQQFKEYIKASINGEPPSKNNFDPDIYVKKLWKESHNEKKL